MGTTSRGFVFGLLIALLGCATGASPKRESTTAPGADLAAYTSFGWQAPSAGAGASEEPLSIPDANLQNAIRAQLVEKGYIEVEYQADFLVRFETSSYVAEKVSNPVHIGVGVGSWGSHVGGGVSTSVPVGQEGVTTAQETRLSIRAVDRKSNREVWYGTAAGGIGQGLDADAVEKAVKKTMADFPPRRR
jgi:hypothetical protein